MPGEGGGFSSGDSLDGAELLRVTGGPRHRDKGRERNQRRLKLAYWTAAVGADASERFPSLPASGMK